jgi:hypothetical protein
VTAAIAHLKAHLKRRSMDRPAALLDANAGELSASTIRRLKDPRADEHLHWSKRDLFARHYVRSNPRVCFQRVLVSARW